MSSNIRITRICDFCGSEFTARTTVTKYCQHKCASKAYKARTRNKNVEKSTQETVKILSTPMVELQSKEFLTLKEASSLINVSRWTISRAVETNRLKAVRLGRRIVIRRSDIDSLFS